MSKKPKQKKKNEKEVPADLVTDKVNSPEIKEEKVALNSKLYEKELRRLQIELVKLQEWVKDQGLKVIVIFEGRDAAGKGGVIKRITESSESQISACSRGSFTN